MTDEAAWLQVVGLTAGYGRRAVVHDASFELERGEVVALIGENGAGKTTLLRAITGFATVFSGDTWLGSERLDRRRPSHVARAGVVQVPEGRRLFTSLTVEQNLLLAARQAVARSARAPAADQAVKSGAATFPILRSRRRQLAGVLSGGEQQLVAIARALLLRPRFLLLDEPSVGLSPGMVDHVLDVLRDAATSQGIGILLVEQDRSAIREVVDRQIVVRAGRLIDGEPPPTTDARDVAI